MKTTMDWKVFHVQFATLQKQGMWIVDYDVK